MSSVWGLIAAGLGDHNSFLKSDFQRYIRHYSFSNPVSHSSTLYSLIRLVFLPLTFATVYCSGLSTQTQGFISLCLSLVPCLVHQLDICTQGMAQTVGCILGEGGGRKVGSYRDAEY